MRHVATWLALSTPLFALAAVALSARRTRRGTPGWAALITATADVALVASVFAVLLITMKETGGDGGVRLSPLVDTWRSLAHDGFPRRATAIVVGNALLLAPTAFLAPWRVPRLSRVWLLTALGFGFSATVETVQLLFRPGRTFELDDLILNTAGALAGAVAWFVVRPLLPPALHRRPGRSRRRSAATDPVQVQGAWQ